MRYGKEEERESPHKLVVGYALTSKKTKSFLQPKLEGLARYKTEAHILFSYLWSRGGFFSFSFVRFCVLALEIFDFFKFFLVVGSIFCLVSDFLCLAGKWGMFDGRECWDSVVCLFFPDCLSTYGGCVL